MFAPIIMFVQSLIVKFGLWILGKALAGLINGAADDEVLEKLSEAFDKKIDDAQNISHDAGKAMRSRLIKFCEILKTNLLEDDGTN